MRFYEHYSCLFSTYSPSIVIDQNLPLQHDDDCGIFVLAALETATRAAFDGHFDFGNRGAPIMRMRIQIATHIYLQNLRFFRPLNWQEQLDGDTSIPINIHSSNPITR